VEGPILGISADYHDAAAALVVGGEVVAAAAEERFTRRKHDPSLPVHAMAWCLEEGEVAPGDLAVVAFAGKPFTTYERILASHAAAGPRGFPQLLDAVRSWSARKLWVRYRIERALDALGHRRVRVGFVEHHQAHAAAAYHPSPFDSAAVITLDGVGEWATASIAHGRGADLEILEELRFPDSLGLFYSAMTAYCGFEVNDGEYKLMGLAPFGQPRYARTLLDHVVRIGPNGELQLDQRWFDYRAGRRMAHPRLADVLDGPPLAPGGRLGLREADIAASTQVVLEEAVLAIAARAARLTGEPVACLAGGVALNCVANSRLLADGPFDDLWIQPAAGDDGGAMGAALWTAHQILGRPRPGRGVGGDLMRGAFLGPAFGADEVSAWLTDVGQAHVRPDDVEGVVAERLAAGELVGWFTGAMEFGPRALGHRSILADPRDPEVATRLNLAVKGREGFRPFAPAVLAEDAADWFEIDRPSPYMLRTAPVHPRRRVEVGEASVDEADFVARLALARSTIPACTHVDGSARVQTVDADRNPALHALLSAFRDRTGCPVLLNTSFNRAGEPIVRTPADALRCARAAGLDVVVIEGCVVPLRSQAEVGEAPGPAAAALAGGSSA
jgi:carbamoyltransferase